MSSKKVSVLGLGYIGLPTALAIASNEFKVVGVDVNESVISSLKSGKVHFKEEGLQCLLSKQIKQNDLEFTTTPPVSDIFVICVPTPVIDVSNLPDLSFVERAIQSVSIVLKKGDLIILESTSPVGTTDDMINHLKVLRPDLKFPSDKDERPDIFVSYCPERILPGNALKELLNNDRVIGGKSKFCREKALSFYQSFVNGKCSTTNLKTAEMVKLTENSYRDVNIAFANEISMICDKAGINVWELINLANHHPRVDILAPGAGVGGHCIAVDPWFIISNDPDNSQMIKLGREVNKRKETWVKDKIFSKIIEHKKNNPLTKAEKLKVAIYGIAFKPDVDDLRGSPALNIVRDFVESSLSICLIVEPNIDDISNLQLGSAQLVDLSTALISADIHVLLVNHSEFRDLNSSDFRTGSEIFDVRGKINE